MVTIRTDIQVYRSFDSTRPVYCIKFLHACQLLVLCCYTNLITMLCTFIKHVKRMYDHHLGMQLVVHYKNRCALPSGKVWLHPCPFVDMATNIYVTIRPGGYSNKILKFTIIRSYGPKAVYEVYCFFACAKRKCTSVAILSSNKIHFSFLASSHINQHQMANGCLHMCKHLPAL